jgi:hypothetical protein
MYVQINIGGTYQQRTHDWVFNDQLREIKVAKQDSKQPDNRVPHGAKLVYLVGGIQVQKVVTAQVRTSQAMYVSRTLEAHSPHAKKA